MLFYRGTTYKQYTRDTGGYPMKTFYGTDSRRLSGETTGLGLGLEMDAMAHQVQEKFHERLHSCSGGPVARQIVMKTQPSMGFGML
jgi:hypothetical protein